MAETVRLQATSRSISFIVILLGAINGSGAIHVTRIDCNHCSLPFHVPPPRDPVSPDTGPPINDNDLLERWYTAYKHKQLLSHGRQMIGWDPLAGRIVSWTFTADGGFAAGAWTPTDAGWTVATVGVMPDGTFGKDSDTVIETGLDNLTKAEAPALIHSRMTTRRVRSRRPSISTASLMSF